MTSSSDWLGALQERPAVTDEKQGGAGWIASLGTTGGFAEGFPFARRDPIPAAVKEPSEPPESAPPVVTVPQPDPLADAFERGFEEGCAKARSEHADEARKHAAIRQSFGRLDQAAMDALAADLAETVLDLCSAVIKEYQPCREDLLERCEQAAGRLGTVPPEMRVHLNPEDLDLIQAGEMLNWECIGDPDVERGGLRLVTPDGAVSDTPDDWRRAIQIAIQG